MSRDFIIPKRVKKKEELQDIVPKNNRRYVAYYRVSTKEQGDKRYGLEGQKSAINDFVERKDGVLINEYEEVKTGGFKERVSVDKDISLEKLLHKRPKLINAISECKQKQAVLLILNLSRLGRHALLIEYLLNSEISFISIENENDDPLIIRVRAAIDQEFLEKISANTKRGLAAKKRKEKEWKPGNPERAHGHG